MPIVRLNADGSRIKPHGAQSMGAIQQIPASDGPIIVMVHGYKYLPEHPNHCPHRRIFALQPNTSCWKSQSWPRQLGFGAGYADEGLAIAFGWNARGALWTAQNSAFEAGRALADAIAVYRAQTPARPVHIISHSMGTEVALEALRHLPSGSVQRIVSMTGACYQTRAQDILTSDVGRLTEFVNVVSRENDAFDFLYERLIAPPTPRDRCIGHGLDAPNAVTLQIDCPGTLAFLDRLGWPIGAPQRRICHWSSYTRPGILRLYNALMRQPHLFALDHLRLGALAPAPRWSRLLPNVPRPTVLAGIQTQTS